MVIDNEQRHDHLTAGSLSAGSAKKADSLAPVEEQQGDYALSRSTFQPDGALRTDTGKLTLPKNLLEEDKNLWQLLRPEPVIAVIISVVIFFILFVTFLIWATPSPPAN